LTTVSHISLGREPPDNRILSFEPAKAGGSGKQKNIVDKDYRIDKIFDPLPPALADWLNRFC
jgi:hypothetical protein